MIKYRRIGREQLTDEVKKILIDLHALAFCDEMQNPFHQRFAWFVDHWSTFSVSELAVAPRWRRAGEGQRLLEQLLDARPEAIAVLLVDSTHAKVIAKYKEWGHFIVGDQRPFPDSPLYAVMVKPLR